MNVYALVNGLNALCSLVVAVILLAHQPRRAIHVTYALFSLVIFCWAFLYFIWGIQTDRDSSLRWLKLLFYPCVFVHVAYYHFVLTLTARTSAYRLPLIFGYLTSVALLWFNHANFFFDSGKLRSVGPFSYWPQHSIGADLFLAVQALYVCHSMIILHSRQAELRGQERTRIRLFGAFSLFGWMGGLTNWFYFFESTPIPPFGNPGLTVFMVGTFYLLIKHDIFELNKAIRRASVYSLLTILIAMVYGTFVVLSEQLFRRYAGYNSLLPAVLAAATIAALFDPLRRLLAAVVDRYLFGKNIGEFSRENERMRNELEKQDRLRTVATLAAGMAHEIKNPLTTIKTFTEHLSARRSDPAFLDKFERIVSKEVARVDQTVRQILQYARPAPPRLVRDDIAQVLRETSGLFSAQVLDKRLDLRLYLPDHPLLCLFDPEQIRQALVNLILNAIQATPPGGAIDVSAASSGGAVEIQITDSGPGIPAGDLGRIFDPFFTTKESGSGLGLAIVQGIVREHGGSIRVQSKAPSGTVFTLRFPCPAGQPA